MSLGYNIDKINTFVFVINIGYTFIIIGGHVCFLITRQKKKSTLYIYNRTFFVVHKINNINCYLYY